ncbi:MAG: methyltransferase domain-containing protein [Planctomycetes bacterium]|nr:methyltransferase domain-containing protein [Planctomycetota bacterium]
MNGVDVVVLCAYASLIVELVVFPIPSEASTWQLFTPGDARAAPADRLQAARERSLPQKVLRYFLPTAICVLLWLLPLAAIASPSVGAALWCNRVPALVGPGVALVVIGRAITFVSVLQLRARRRLGGEPRWLFRRSRNPGLVGMFVCYTGLCCLFGSPLSWLGLPFYVANMHVRVRMEEAHLAAQFGDAWRSYVAAVPRYVGRSRWSTLPLSHRGPRLGSNPGPALSRGPNPRAAMDDSPSGRSTRRPATNYESQQADAPGEASPGRRPMDDRVTSQAEVAAWFDATYREKGLRYLRPRRAYPIFVQLLGAKAGDRLLDVACGPGLLLCAAVEREIATSGVDLSHEAVALARELVPAAQVQQGNAEHLPFADGVFDHVTCLGSIERFLDREKALREMQRVAKPDARFCFLVRNASTFVWRVWREGLGRREVQGHQDALTLVQWRELFGRCGFAVERVLPDQWPRQRVRQVLPWWRPRPGRSEPVAGPIVPLRWCNELVFVLRRAATP